MKSVGNFPIVLRRDAKNWRRRVLSRLRSGYKKAHGKHDDFLNRVVDILIEQGDIDFQQEDLGHPSNKKVLLAIISDEYYRGKEISSRLMAQEIWNVLIVGCLRQLIARGEVEQQVDRFGRVSYRRIKR